jgi:hypothetical protein
MGGAGAPEMDARSTGRTFYEFFAGNGLVRLGLREG